MHRVKSRKMVVGSENETSILLEDAPVEKVENFLHLRSIFEMKRGTDTNI